MLQFGWCCILHIFLMLMTSVSYSLTLISLMFTTTELKTWHEYNKNHTNFEEIKMEHFQMHIFMNAYLLIIIINIFYVELSFWGRRSFIQLWGTEEWTAHRFIGSILIYLGLLVPSHLISLLFSPMSKEQYVKVKKKLQIIFLLILIKYLQNEYTPYQLTKLYFYFQLAAISCLFILTIDHIAIYLVHTRYFETKDNKTQSNVIMDKKKEQCFQSEKKAMPVSLLITNQDDKTAQIS